MGGAPRIVDAAAKPYPKPVKNQKDLDKRRAEMGLSTEKEYLDVVIEFQKQMREKAKTDGGTS